MVDEVITKQELIDAQKDAQSLDDFINGGDEQIVITRLLKEYPTLANAIRQIYEKGGKFYPTLAAANSDIANIRTDVYVITADNGAYYKATAGATTLTKSPYDPVQLSKLNAASLSVIGDYLTETSKREIATLGETSTKYLIAKAIKKVAITNPIAGKKYEIRAVYKNSASSGSRISIADDTGTVSSIIIPVETVVSGIQEYSLSGNRNGKVLIDWDVLPAPLQETNLGLFFDNNTYLQTYLNTAASAENSVAISAIDTRTTALEDFARIGLPTWLPDSAISAFKAAPEIQKTVAGAIAWIEMYGTTALQYVRISTVTKNDATFGSRVTMVNNLGAELCRFSASSSIVKSGVEVVDLAERNSSGVTAKLKINWDALADGVSVSGSSALVVKWDAQDNSVESIKVKVLENTNEIEQIQSQLADFTQQSISKVATKPYKVAIAGSSITWGQGYLGEGSYVGVVEQILRNQYAKTTHASVIAPNATTINGNDFYQGSIKRISGLNTEVSFNLDGDELSLSIARERENTGACLVELYVDNVLYDTFDTSTKPSVSRTENFTGNGSTIKFNLDGCFTYNHVVTVGGVAKVGKLATSNAIPASDDYMVIRRYDSVNNRVVHALWFKEAPTGAIAVTYKQGENIRHLKGTIDRIGAGYSTALEYQYGDGSTAYDPANPTAISSGFGFRESDQRSVKTWKFSESKMRSYKLKIKTLHSSATGSTPYLDLNFVTNRMHHIMNAGIGGWSAVELIDDAIKLNTIQEVINFSPDIVLIESCTNDDSRTGVFKAHIVRTGLTAEQILAEPTANYFTAISGTASNKTVNDVRIPMTAITSNTITLAPDVVDASIAVGDAVIIGDYGCNHQRVAVRVIKAYDSATKTITLNRSISADEFYQAESLSDLLPEFVMIYNAPTWADQNDQLVEIIESALPDCKINIATAGIPHFYLRKLFGYREIAQKVAKDNHIGFVDYYNATFDYQYSQQVSTHQTITSTGASEYTLTGSAHTFPNPKVFVNGVEHKKVRITGGLSKHWASGVTDPTLSNVSNLSKSFKLIFDANVPASGATIVVQKSATVWANDYCHPIGPQGFHVLGQSASKILKDAN